MQAARQPRARNATSHRPQRDRGCQARQLAVHAGHGAVQQQNSSQHSMLIGCTWLGADLTMAGWLHEHNGRRVHTAVWENLVNAAMCALTAVLIQAYC